MVEKQWQMQYYVNLVESGCAKIERVTDLLAIVFISRKRKGLHEFAKEQKNVA